MSITDENGGITVSLLYFALVFHPVLLQLCLFDDIESFFMAVHGPNREETTIMTMSRYVFLLCECVTDVFVARVHSIFLYDSYLLC